MQETPTMYLSFITDTFLNSSLIIPAQNLGVWPKKDFYMWYYHIFTSAHKVLILLKPFGHFF